MRKILLASLVLLAMASPVFAQSTIVTATVRDSSNIPYSLARVSAQLVPTGTAPTINGQQISATAQTQADINGVINFNLFDNAMIVPGGSQWQITVCETPGVQPPLGTGSQCFTITATISGATQSLTVPMVAAAPALTNLAFATVSAPPVNSVQYNNAGAFGGSASLAWNDTTKELDISNTAFLNARVRIRSVAGGGGGGQILFGPGALSPRIKDATGWEFVAKNGQELSFGQEGEVHSLYLPGAIGVANLGIANLPGQFNFNDGTSAPGVFLGPKLLAGTGTPETAITARVGSLFMRTDGTIGSSIYVKQTGTGNTGWAPISAIAAGTNQQVTYNDNGTTAGALGLLWDKTNNRQAILLVPGQTIDPWFIEDSGFGLKASFKVDGGGYFPYFNAGLTGGALTSTTGGVRFTKTDFLAFRNNANGGDIPGVALNTVDQVVLGGISGIASPTNCADSAGPAACGSAYAGAVVIDAGATAVVVSTTAVTANSEIFLQYDSSLGTRLSVTCNVTVALPSVTFRTPGTNFTITVPAAPIVNPACYNYFIVN